MSFSKILIPVDFTVNTEVAIKKALDLCEGPGVSIHLLHVANYLPTNAFDYYRYLVKHSPHESAKQATAVKEKLEQWSHYIREARNEIDVHYSVIPNSPVERAIIEKARDIDADLIIIGKNCQHSLFPFLNTVVSGRIASRSGTSVLTVKPGALSSCLRTVVVPVGSTFPASKVAVINSLGSKIRIHIRLLILVEKGDDPDSLQTSLLKVCRVLINRPFTNISYDVLKVSNKGGDILNYCRLVDADLLIVQDSEANTGWLHKHISDELPVSSRTQVLAVNPSPYSII